MSFTGQQYYRIYLGTNPYDPKERMDLGTIFPYSELGKNGYVSDSDLGYDSTLCLENDKMVRLHNFTKLPNLCGKLNGTSYKQGRKEFWDSDRNYHSNRYIFYRGYLSAEKEYYIRFQALTGKDFSHTLSSIELVPENVYGNPDKAEDIW